MHKDKPPGIFEFERRSLQHVVGVGLATGVLLSVIIEFALMLWRADAGPGRPRLTADEAERTFTAHRMSKSSPPSETPAVRY